jgi:transcriptional regulator with XRE-family HTH domain
VDPQEVIGRNIRRERKRQGLSQESLADFVGTSVTQVSRAERGERDLRASTIVRFAKGLEVAPAELLRDL